MKKTSNPRTATKPRLRFDKVVIRLTERLQANLGPAVPDGCTVAITVTAPIRLPAKTAACVEDKVQTLLTRKSPRDAKATIHGNGVRIRVLRERPRRAPKVLVFVHNADSDPIQFLDDVR